VRGAVGTTPHTLEDRRASSNWGAAGLSTQDIVLTFLLNYSSDVAAALTVAGIYAVLRKLRHRYANTASATSSPLSANQAWATAEKHLQDAYKIRKAEAVATTKTGEGWKIEVRGDQCRVHVIVGTDGLIERAWRQDE